MRQFLLSLFAVCFAGSTVAQTPGDLDTFFNQTGIVTLQPGTQHDNIGALVVQPDQKIVFCGVGRITATTGFVFDMVVGRLNTNGSLDTTFSGDGYFSYGSAGGSVYGYDVQLQPDGKIVACGGYSVTAGNPEILAVRLNTDGSPDTTFGGGDGIEIIPVGTSEDYAYDLKILPDGKFILAGASKAPGFNYNRGMLMRLMSDGSLDTTFGTAGITLWQIGGTTSETFRCMDVLPGGRIVAAGYSYQSNTDYLIMAGFTPDGILDSTFATNGYFFGSTISYAYDLALHDDQIYLGGRLSTSMGYDLALMAFDTTGAVSTTFGFNGSVILDVNPIDVCYGLVVQPDGKIIAGGTSGLGTINNRDFIAAKYTSAGVLDPTFGNNGYIIHSVGGAFDEANAIALQNDGKILLGGFAALANNDMVVMRLLNDAVGVGVAEVKANDPMVLYPSPVTGTELHVLLPAVLDGHAVCTITDITGRRVVSEQIAMTTGSGQQASIQLPGALEAGLYIVTISSASAIYSAPFIRQ